MKLYVATVSLIMDGTKRAEAQKNLAVLEATLKNTKAGTGTHDKGAVGALINRHNQEVQACYEAALAANPKLGGTLTVNVEADQTGGIKGKLPFSWPSSCMLDCAFFWSFQKLGSEALCSRVSISCFRRSGSKMPPGRGHTFFQLPDAGFDFSLVHRWGLRLESPPPPGCDGRGGDGTRGDEAYAFSSSGWGRSCSPGTGSPVQVGGTGALWPLPPPLPPKLPSRRLPPPSTKLSSTKGVVSSSSS